MLHHYDELKAWLRWCRKMGLCSLASNLSYAATALAAQVATDR
jgi:hypothetical protein